MFSRYYKRSHGHIQLSEGYLGKTLWKALHSLEKLLSTLGVHQGSPLSLDPTPPSLSRPDGAQHCREENQEPYQVPGDLVAQTWVPKAWFCFEGRFCCCEGTANPFRTHIFSISVHPGVQGWPRKMPLCIITRSPLSQSTFLESCVLFVWGHTWPFSGLNSWFCAQGGLLVVLRGLYESGSAICKANILPVLTLEQVSSYAHK